MTTNFKENFSLNHIGFGLTAFMQMVGFTLCFCAVSGQGLLVALICITACATLSLISKNAISVPNPLYFVAFFYVCQNTSIVGAFVSISIASIIYILLKKFLNKRQSPDHIVAGISLGLCIGATILLTNSYFGIGATGATPLEMLKSYRSLGFHPHFMGLLTGTITLFAMITYPFKFKKLSKIIPASFITIVIPFVLNLFLNPDTEYTAINEANFFVPLQSINVSELFYGFSSEQIFTILESIIIFFWLFVVMSDSIEKQKLQISSILSPFPTSTTSINGYGLLSAIIALGLTVFSFILFPQVFARLPIHSAGAMLIVAGWQSIPYKKLVNTFRTKEKKALKLVCFFVCTLSFILLNAYTATIISIIMASLSSPERKEKTT